MAVEVADVDVPKAACQSMAHSISKAIWFMDTKDMPAGGLGDLNLVGFQAAERVARQTLVEQCGHDQIGDAALERAQIGGADVGDRQREQRACVGD